VRLINGPRSASLTAREIDISDPPFEGVMAEEMVGMAPGTVLVTMRMMQLGNGPGLELFEVRGPDRRPPVRFSDFGLQHFALEKGEGNVWRYGRTPWGSVIELVSALGAQEYEHHTPLRRWKPPAWPRLALLAPADRH
jgi:hypothetical protein